jgi:hypothetical protein
MSRIVFQYLLLSGVSHSLYLKSYLRFSTACPRIGFCSHGVSATFDCTATSQLRLRGGRGGGDGFHADTSAPIFSGTMPQVSARPW